MIDIIVYKSGTGRPLRAMRLRDAAEADQNTRPGEAWIEALADLRRDRVADGQIVPRPAIAAIPPGGPAPVVVDPGLWPTGSTLTARNEEGDEIVLTDPPEPLVLTDPGIYRLAVAPPWPWLPATGTVEVRDA